MLLEDLLQVVERIQGRIKEHGDQLGQSEALTRNALVDPLLRALGWDMEDPALVMPEYKVDSGFADYALLSDGKPAIVIEAKKLGTPLDKAAAQGINYCINDGIAYFVATDGKQWDIYETHRQVPRPEKKIVGFDLDDASSDVCLDALALWRRSVQNGAIRKAETPLLEPQGATLVASHSDDNKIQEAVNTLVPQPEPVAISPLPAGNWLPLPQLHPEKRDSAPQAICFPDGSITSIKYWADIPNSVVDWLQRQGKLDETCIPIQRGTRYILSTDPVHSNGTNFRSPRKVGQFYLEGSYRYSHHVIEKAVIIIETVGIGLDPKQFRVMLPD